MQKQYGKNFLCDYQCCTNLATEMLWNNKRNASLWIIGAVTFFSPASWLFQKLLLTTSKCVCINNHITQGNVSSASFGEGCGCFNRLRRGAPHAFLNLSEGFTQLWWFWCSFPLKVICKSTKVNEGFTNELQMQNTKINR